MSVADLQRLVFSTSRAAEFLDRRALQSQTGQPVEAFGDVVAKELLDNAFDAAESAGVAPQVEIDLANTDVADQPGFYIGVADNGAGILPDVVERILDFGMLVSDKFAYRSPTRGALGNALKTVLGIPYALDVTEPVIIEAHRVRHEIAVSIDPAGNLVVTHDRVDSPRTAGTRVAVPLPFDVGPEEGWPERFAVFNPHARLCYHGNAADSNGAVFYKPSVNGTWRKPLPTDRTSPHWYDGSALKRLVFAHIGASRNGSRDLPLGEFIRSFDGLSSSVKAKTVAQAVPAVDRLSDFESDPDSIEALLAAMRAQAKVPKPTILGGVPEEHYRACLDGWFGVKRFWFKRKQLLDQRGVPWLIEVAAATTRAPGDVFYGVNYSPTFSDPLADFYLPCHEYPVTGTAGFLSQADAYPDHSNGELRAAVVHIVCPALEHLDKGKARLVPTPEATGALSAALKSVTKDLYKERKRRERDARTAARPDPSYKEDRVTLRAAVFDVMEDAAAAAGGNGDLRFSARTLYYQIRPRIQAHTDRELEYSYCSQMLLPDYQSEFGPLPGLYYEPRGHLHEPHTGRSVPLGTLEVQEYVPSEWTFNKILYVEKEGLWPVLQDAELAERFDLAVIVGQGYAVEACRSFLQSVKPGEYRIFVVHDADWSGYNIARTLAEETRRMPGYSVQVTDLGLTVADAIEKRLPPEAVTRKKGIPARVLERLDATEREWFVGHRIGFSSHYLCTRVELNAFAGPELIAFIEAGLEHNDATGKLIPPHGIIKRHAANHHQVKARLALEDCLHQLIDFDALVSELVQATTANAQVTVTDVEKALANNAPVSWRKAVDARVDAQLKGLEESAAAVLAERGIGEVE